MMYKFNVLIVGLGSFASFGAFKTFGGSWVPVAWCGFFFNQNLERFLVEYSLLSGPCWSRSLVRCGQSSCFTCK